MLPFAAHHLGKTGELYPFGAVVDQEGDVGIRMAMPDDSAHPDSQSVLDMLHENARTEATGIRAAAFVSDVMANGSDAIRIDLEHREGSAITLVIPYTRRRFRKDLVLGDMAVLSSQATTWID